MELFAKLRCELLLRFVLALDADHVGSKLHSELFGRVAIVLETNGALLT